jgi:hypothetical protein
MALDDFLDSEVAVAVAAAAAIFSPQARRLMRRGAVYGLASVLAAGDIVSSAARGLARGVRRDAPTVGQGLQDITDTMDQSGAVDDADE